MAPTQGVKGAFRSATKGAAAAHATERDGAAGEQRQDLRLERELANEVVRHRNAEAKRQRARPKLWP